MKRQPRPLLALLAFTALWPISVHGQPAPDGQGRRIQLAAQPELSADGQTLLFVHRGDIWSAPTQGGQARRLTVHPASDSDPRFSPDGTQLAFTSDRSGSSQIYVMPSQGGVPIQRTFHTEGSAVQDWYPDGTHLLVQGTRDHFWRSAARLFRISATDRSAETLLFNDYGNEASISPDGTKVLFVREGEREWRKGYQGARAAQIWLYEPAGRKFTKIVQHSTDSRSPVWLTDGSGFLFCGSQDSPEGTRNLWKYSFASGEATRLTSFDDDLVTQPVLSADGRTLVFRHLFDLYAMDPSKDLPPRKIELTESVDDAAEDVLRRTLTNVTDAAFSQDGLEVAFIAGGDLWVMDTQLREPVQVTRTAEFESDPVFVDDGNGICLVSWKDGQADLYRITRGDDTRYWWQNSVFQTTQLTSDTAVESHLTLSPNGHELAYVRERGDLWIRDLSSGRDRLVVPSFSDIQYDFSPDGQWITYATSDNDFNNDVWITPVDLSQAPVCISRHPDDEGNPVWSKDGKLLAFTGRRADDEVDLYYVWLTDEDDTNSTRDRQLKKSLEAFRKSRQAKTEAPAGKAAKDHPPAAGQPAGTDSPTGEKPGPQPAAAGSESTASSTEKSAGKFPNVRIDFDGIHRRIRHISIPNSRESALAWAPDNRTLVFNATVAGESGTWSVEFPDKLTPKKITGTTGRIRGWLRSPDRFLWIVAGGTLAAQPLSGAAETYSFRAPQELSKSSRFLAGFDTAWRVMRDHWYDDNFGNRNWDQVRRKYASAARDAGTLRELTYVIELMLGELNGSHLGFTPQSSSAGRRGASNPDSPEWQPVTAHPGVRFNPAFRGPGLQVRDVIPNGPATAPDSRIEPGDVILQIDGTAVDPGMDLTGILNGRLDRDMTLKVRSAEKDGAERDVVLRPISYAQAREQLYQKWMDDNRALVARTADNIGYLHIRGMDWPSFLEFERELYDVGYGREGLIIDVRDNGGGSTTDHLLTALTQPRHAITVPRGGSPGYPQSRMVYATWDKPIVVLCNQNSYSNAEIFSHAIKGLKRGKLVGVPTAGGVVSTGAARIMDLGMLRLPTRGWFIKWTGQDMELNGAVPDVVIWPLPNEIPNGRDRQLTKAVQVLQQQIRVWKSTPAPELKKATERAAR